MRAIWDWYLMTCRFKTRHPFEMYPFFAKGIHVFFFFPGGGVWGRFFWMLNHEVSLVDTQVPNQDNMEMVHFSTLLNVKNLPISATPERPATCPQQLSIKLALIFWTTNDLCWGLNSHCFPMVGMVINLMVGLYIPITGLPFKGGMTIPNTHRIHVWYIYHYVLLHLVDFYGKCMWIYHAWILRDIRSLDPGTKNSHLVLWENFFLQERDPGIL